MSRGCLGSRTVGSLGVHRSPRPMSRRNTRSMPSIRSCSSCCGGARSSTACSARSSTASSEPAAAAATSPPRALDGGTPPPPASLPLESALAADPGNVLLEMYRNNKAMVCLWISVGLCTGCEDRLWSLADLGFWPACAPWALGGARAMHTGENQQDPEYKRA